MDTTSNSFALQINLINFLPLSFSFLFFPFRLIATPGRLVHHMNEVGLSLRTVEYIVFDEADRLFEMGFAPDIHKIMSSLPENKQTLLFSATLPGLLVEFARAGLNSDAELIRLDAETKLPEALKVRFVPSYYIILGCLNYMMNEISRITLRWIQISIIETILCS